MIAGLLVIAAESLPKLLFNRLRLQQPRSPASAPLNHTGGPLTASMSFFSASERIALSEFWSALQVMTGSILPGGFPIGSPLGPHWVPP